MTAKVLATLAPAQLQLEIIEIGRLPLYNQDDDGARLRRGWTFALRSRRPTRSCSLRRNTTDPAMPQPEAYIGGAAALFDKEGNLTNENTRKFLRSFIEAFAAWIEILLAR